MSVSALTGIGGYLLPGDQITLPAEDFDLGSFWIDTDSTNAATEKVFVTVL